MMKNNKKDDVVIFFGEERSCGVLIQENFNQAIFFANGKPIDILPSIDDLTPHEFSDWVNTKREHYNLNKSTL